jgi:release factor glutamine methyltransferase
MLTVLEVIKKTADFFSSKGVDSARLNAELLIGHALRLPRMQLYLQFERTLTEPELVEIRALVRRRGQREPLQYILGSVDFLGLKLKADSRALIPRPETERLVEILVGRCAAAPPARVLDLGTGTGAIALALASAWTSAMVWAVDKSAAALALAAENAAATGLAGRVKLLQSDWFAQLPAEARFNLVVANPPYLSSEETRQTAPEVREHEPASALIAGEEGLGAARAILSGAPRFLEADGWLALETSGAHHAELRATAVSAWARTESLPDLTGRDRYFFAWPKVG